MYIILMYPNLCNDCPIMQIRGFYGQKIYFQCQIHNLSTLSGALVADLSSIRVNLHIFLTKTYI